MRDPFSSLLASRAGKLALSLLLASPDLISRTTAFTFNPIPSPNIDIQRLGRVTLAGDFDSISLYQFQGQTEQPASSNGALLSRYPNGLFATIQNTDGDVKTMCAFSRNNTYQGIVFGGNFTSVAGHNTPGGIALLNTNDGSVTPLAGLNGSVNAVYCDSGNNGRVYIGGSFTGGNSSNAIVWVDNWTNMPFSGFNGPVHSIAKAPNGNIIFGGEFNGLAGNESSPTQNDTQVLPIGSANITAQTSSGQTGLTEPKNIVCKSDQNSDGEGSTWLLADNTPGFWRADFGFGFNPTKLNLHNTKLDGRGTKTWRYTALPDGGIMNFSYVDPSGNKAFCDARCPLPQGNTSAQEFTFVNSVGMNAFKIDISDWYGQGGGLAGIELFQNDIYTYAINDFNEPKCGGVTTGAIATSSGPWVNTPSHDSASQYLTATLQGDSIDPNSASVVFEPDIKQSGQYSVQVFTPGCKGDGTCSTRGRVNITGTMNRDNIGAPLSATLFQTNDFDKYDEIYVGQITATDGFRPSVTLSPASGQSGTLTVVAQRVRFTLKNANATSSGLNGLFEYNANQQNVDTDFSKSVIDTSATNLVPKTEAIITAVATDSNRLYVGGNFSGDGFNNIYAIGNGATNATALKGNGLNNQVMTLYQSNSTLYAGGNFTNTQDNSTPGLNGVAAYSNDQWQPLGAGVNGVVMYIIPFTLNITLNKPELVLGLTGFFNQVNAFGKNASFSVDNFAIWVPSRSNWLQNFGVSTVSVSGKLMAFANVPGSNPVFAGSVSSQSISANGAVNLPYDGTMSVEQFPVTLRAQQQQSSLRKRALSSTQDLNTTGVVAAAFFKDGMNKTVLAGHFAATSTDGQNITNLLVIDGNDSNRVTGLADGIDSNSTFAALGKIDKSNVLFAGGSVSGTLNNNKLAGMVAYDLSSNKLAGTQPPGLQGTNVAVNAISPRPKSQDVFVGGVFESAGALSCSALCIWNTERNQWTSPGGDFSGTVTSLTWIADTTLLIAGNLTVGKNQTKIVTFDSAKNDFQEFANSRALPGPVTALCPASSDGKQVWASGQNPDGSAFLERFDGKVWHAVNITFAPGTNIRGLQVLTLSKNHDKSNFIDQNQDLLILGTVNITNFGTASGALYDGSKLTPFLLSTTSQNTAGSLSQVFTENPFNFKSGGKHLALGFIVLIALAVALALTFLLVVAGILLEWYRKRSKGYQPAPTAYPDRNVNTSRIPPEHLFGTLRGNQTPAI